jgi:hypothetical protein
MMKLQVILTDDSRCYEAVVFLGIAPPAPVKRIVTVELTPSQIEQITPRQTWSGKHARFERIECFIEAGEETLKGNTL